MFEIDPAFLATSHPLGEMALCHTRLQGDARFPWVVLIPRLDKAQELEDLGPEDRNRLLEEVLRAGAAVRAVGLALGRPVQKLNVGQLGNVTAQLHLHVVGRRGDDPAWPGPVWGRSAAQPYRPKDLDLAITAARAALGL